MEFIILIVVVAAGGWFGVAGVRTVPSGQVGVVTKVFDTRPRRPEDDPRVSFLDAAGPQARLLHGNTRTWLVPWLYRVELVPQTYVPSGTIGVVVAKAGVARPPDSSIAQHVECDHFQDGERFLRDRGQQGRQLEVLPSGFYDINPVLFEVITVHTPEAMAREGLTAQALAEIEIEIGETGVVVTHFGAKPHLVDVGPPVDGHRSFQLPWVFLAGGGWRGVQRETLDEGGRYTLNPWFAHVVEVPTRVLILEWTKDKKTTSNLDISLGQVVLDVQGYTVRLDMKQTVRIPATAAPGIVRNFGLGGQGEAGGRSSVQEFVKKELAATVDAYFRRISSRYRIQEFITRYNEVCNELAGEVRQALDRTGVDAITTTLENFECDEPEINDMRRQIAVQQESVKLEEAKLAELRARKASEEVRNETALQQVKVEEERRRLDFVELKMLVELLGPEHVTVERVLAQWVKVNVPQYIGGSDVMGMLQSMPMAQTRDIMAMIKNVAARAEPDPSELTSGNNGSAEN
ncbi:SPFH domain-containing protein [Saccharothrix sp. NRRL B-16314]|uniref:SPFH domain-containing protein n=1 Tax=Saccharothrix sp. NRRL B-16314 TaxID=1463825 RepID=UPI000691986E|nr:SPFH domain-containing protein [Saccharothrix sp. NRRL B-16314]